MGYPNTSKFVKNTPLRVVFSTLFSVFGYPMKHCLSCLIYYVKLGILADSRSFLANQKARNAIVGAENLLKADKPRGMLVDYEKNL